MSRISLSDLNLVNACSSQRNLFEKLFGDSVEITVDLCVKHANDFNWDFAARHFLSETARDAYHAADAYDTATKQAIKQARDAYNAAIKSARDAFHAAYKTARIDAYFAAIKPVEDAFHAATQPANDAFHAAYKAATDAYNAAKATAFATNFLGLA